MVLSAEMTGSCEPMSSTTGSDWRSASEASGSSKRPKGFGRDGLSLRDNLRLALVRTGSGCLVLAFGLRLACLGVLAVHAYAKSSIS